MRVSLSRLPFARPLAVWAGLALVAGAPAAEACPEAPQPELPRSALAVETTDGRHVFSVELAATEEEKACGLMLRQRLGTDEGMLFAYSPPGPAFMWMANTLISLDMLFIAEDGRVVHIAERTEPLSRRPLGTRSPVAGVLELKAGTVARLGVRRGDRVRHPIFEAE